MKIKFKDIRELVKLEEFQGIHQDCLEFKGKYYSLLELSTIHEVNGVNGNSWHLKELGYVPKSLMEEPYVDWAKVPVDTKVYVRDIEGEEWTPRHFAKIENDTVYAWQSGKTSFTTSGTTPWLYAKLAEGEDLG